MEMFVLFWFWHPESNGSLDSDVEDSRTVFKCFWSRAQTKPLSITDIQYLKATMSIRGENYASIDRKSGQHWDHFKWCVVSVLCIPMITKFPNPPLTFVHLCFIFRYIKSSHHHSICEDRLELCWFNCVVSSGRVRFCLAAQILNFLSTRTRSLPLYGSHVFLKYFIAFTEE